MVAIARTGRPPKPVEHHIAVGTFQQSRHGTQSLGAALALVPQAEVTVADRTPGEVMESVFAAGMRWLGTSDGVAITMLRESIEEREALRAAVMSGSYGLRKELRDLDKQIMSQLSALGFDPAARARLGLAEVKAADKISQITSRDKSRTIDAEVVSDSDDAGA